MIHIILLILKIIGIILLSLLGLLLLILLVVLLVPVRYKIEAKHGEEVLKADVRVHWLLHIFRARVTYLEGELKIKVKILCFLLFDNQKPKQEEKKQFGLRQRINNAKKEKSLKKKTFKETSRQDKKKKRNKVRTRETESKQLDKHHLEDKQPENPQSDINAEVVKSKDIAKERIKDDIKAMVETPEGSEEADKKIVDVVKESVEATVKKVEDIVTEDIPPMPEDTIEENILSEKKAKYKEAKYKEARGMRSSFGFRFGLIWQRLKTIKASFTKWINWVKEWGSTVSSWKNKLDTVIHFFKDKVTKEGLKETYSSLKKILKHIAPKKLKSTLIFGTGDPCSTGQALGMISILYSFYGDKVKIIPDFEKKVLEGEHKAKGRIRLLTILIIAIKLLVNKKFQLLKENFQRLKEAL